MNVYIVEVNNKVAGKAIIAANDYKEAERVFNEYFDYSAYNPIKDWNCNIYLSDTFQTNVITPQMLFNCIY